MSARLRRLSPLAAAIVAGTSTSLYAQQCPQGWQPGPLNDFASYGTDMQVDSCTVWTPSGSFPRLVIGGRFTSLDGGSVYSHVAQWDGSTWLPMGVNGLNGDVMALFDYNGTLVAAGAFNAANGVSLPHIAQWNGSAWVAMGSLGDYGAALAMHSGFLYVGGNFTTTNAGAANHLARWDGSAWQPANAGVDNTVFALGNNTVSGSSVESLIIGGEFTHANGMSANHIVGYNLGLATPWYTLGTGTNGIVYAISGGYAGGSFTTAGGVSTGGFALWNGFNWQANGGTFTGAVTALTPWYDPFNQVNTLAIGGVFPGINNSPNIAFYNGSTYSTPGTGGVSQSGSVTCMASYNSSLFVGGNFTTAGPLSIQNFARWSGNPVGGWDKMPQGVGGPVRSLVGGSQSLEIGGDFITWQASNGPALRCVATDGVSYFAETNIAGGGPPAGTNGSVNAVGHYIHTFNFLTHNDFIVGGSFTQVGGGVSASNIAQLTTAGGWGAMGSGADNRVDAILQYGTHVYAAGEFASMNGLATPGIAEWNGAWSAPGTGGLRSGANNGAGYALTVYNNELIVGGSFSTAGGVAATCVARWNNTAWNSCPGATLSGNVRALTVFNSQLIAAGDFTGSGGATIDRVGSWNGSAWTDMHAGLPVASAFTPRALTVDAGDLYLGGSSPFDENGGAPASVYKWNGASWVAVPGSTHRPVYALAEALGSLWAGGDFGVSNGISTPNLAKIINNCYANCDCSVTSPLLNVNDFTCFLQKFASADPYANCDGSTSIPLLNVTDFTCFLQKFAQGCP